MRHETKTRTVGTTIFMDVVEKFTHKIEINGRILRGDPENRFWADGSSSWYGTPPKGWDESKAILEKFETKYQDEKDVS